MTNAKKKYYIILGGNYVGINWAVSPEKAISNWWWKYIKKRDVFSQRRYGPEDFDVIEADWR